MNLASKVLNKPNGSYVATLPFIDIKKYFYSENEAQEDEENDRVCKMAIL